VIEDRRRPRFAPEAFDEPAIAGELWMENLDCDIARQHRVMRPKDLAHPAGGDPGDHLIAALDGGFDH
jgi:hypothetical protein